MAEMKDATISAVAYHVIDGPQEFPYAVDAQSAVGRHPLEWSFRPWSDKDAEAGRRHVMDRYEREREEAERAAGDVMARRQGVALPARPRIVEPVELTPEEQAAIDEHAAAVAEANERLKAFRADQAEKQKIADQVAADEALVASPPPRPDPAARRPTAKEKRAEFLKLTPVEQAEKDAREKADDDAAAAKKAADDKIADDKAAADAQANSQPVKTQPVA